MIYNLNYELQISDELFNCITFSLFALFSALCSCRTNDTQFQLSKHSYLTRIGPATMNAS